MPSHKPAGDGAISQLARLLQVIPALADGEEHVLTEVAERAGVDRETLTSDLRALSERYDAPGGFVEGVQIYLEPDRVSLVGDVFDRPMRLTRAELGALELGLALLRRQWPREEHVLTEVAERAGVDRETLTSDLRALSERYDAPGGFVEGVQIYLEPDRVSLVGDVFDRPMRLTRAELGALELGLALLRRQRPREEHRAIDGAAERVRQVMAALPADWEERQPVGELGTDADLAHFRALQLARQRRRKVRLAYRKVGEATADHRTICPCALAFASGRWYLIARCEPGEAIRIFRLDRVEAVETLDQGFELPGSFTPDRYLADGKAFYAEKPETLRVRYGPAVARWVAEREGLEPEPDGSLVVEHPLADPEWAVRHVLQYGPDAEVLAPVSVRVELRRRLMEMGAGGSAEK